MNLIENIITIMCAVLAVITGCMLDSANPAPLYVCSLCMIWLVLYAIRRY